MTTCIAQETLPLWASAVPGWLATVIGLVAAVLIAIFVVHFPRWWAARKSHSDWTTPGKWGTW